MENIETLCEIDEIELLVIAQEKIRKRHRRNKKLSSMSQRKTIIQEEIYDDIPDYAKGGR